MGVESLAEQFQPTAPTVIGSRGRLMEEIRAPGHGSEDGLLEAPASSLEPKIEEEGTPSGVKPDEQGGGATNWRLVYNPDVMVDAIKKGSRRIRLDLSGTEFVTTVDTLLRDERSYFCAMMRLQAPLEDGQEPRTEFFIDRDPTHFRHILNYLRDGKICLENRGVNDLAFLEELLTEAQFYNINGLCEELQLKVSVLTKKVKEGPSGDKDYRLVSCQVGHLQEVFHEWVLEKNYEFESMDISGEMCYIILGRRVSRGELALVERLMKT
ncbi:unnamed protein product [Chrysoparadoxa australica]